jgi:streptogramin lyase
VVRERALGAVALLALVVVAGLVAYNQYYVQGKCKPTKASQTTFGPLKSASFGAVTEYAIPAGRLANGIMVDSDGSIWFGEQSLPGLGHYVPSTGMLTEFQWPCYPTSKNGGVVSSIWGIAEWSGRVWTADGDSNRLVGLDPKDGATVYVNTTSATFPYFPTVAPDNSLWFTSLSAPAKLGRLGADMSLAVIPVQGLGHKEPIQMEFINSTFAYMVALDPYDSTDSGIYSFDPVSGPTLSATKVGGSFRLFYPQSLSISQGTIWVAQHFPSNLLGYDIRSGSWTTYPTSTLRYENSTLPYFVEAEGSSVWFNEHYANKIARLNPGDGVLTEYSESNPPVSNATQIQNDLTIALSSNKLWFTSTTGDYIGYVNAGFEPSFSVSKTSSSHVALEVGGSLTAQLEVDGSWSKPLSVQVSDSEAPTSFPRLLTIKPAISTIPAGSGPVPLQVVLGARPGIQPGTYTVAVTVTDGLTYQTAYLFLTVS